MRIEMPTARFRDICQLVRHLQAAGAFFTPQVTYIESPDAPRRRLYGDYVFLPGAETTEAVAIGRNELQRIAQMIKLDKQTDASLVGETIRIEPHRVTCLPYGTRYQRTTYMQAVKPETADRLAILSSHAPPRQFVLLPDGRPKGRGMSVHLTLRDVILRTSQGKHRLYGFSNIKGKISFTTPTGRALFAFAEQAGGRLDGHERDGIVFLNGEDFSARIHIEKRN